MTNVGSGMSCHLCALFYYVWTQNIFFQECHWKMFLDKRQSNTLRLSQVSATHKDTTGIFLTITPNVGQ